MDLLHVHRSSYMFSNAILWTRLQRRECFYSIQGSSFQVFSKSIISCLNWTCNGVSAYALRDQVVKSLVLVNFTWPLCIVQSSLYYNSANDFVGTQCFLPLNKSLKIICPNSVATLLRLFIKAKSNRFVSSEAKYCNLNNTY